MPIAKGQGLCLDKGYCDYKLGVSDPTVRGCFSQLKSYAVSTSRKEQEPCSTPATAGFWRSPCQLQTSPSRRQTRSTSTTAPRFAQSKRWSEKTQARVGASYQRTWKRQPTSLRALQSAAGALSCSWQMAEAKPEDPEFLAPQRKCRQGADSLLL